jgi:hypothetical protein
MVNKLIFIYKGTKTWITTSKNMANKLIFIYKGTKTWNGMKYDINTFIF